MTATVQDPYRSRLTSVLGLWELDGWRFKVFFISVFEEPNPSGEFLTAAKTVASQVVSAIHEDEAPSHVGFVIIHEGKRGLFVSVDWWGDTKELHHECFYWDRGAPLRLERMKLTDSIGCVWDLRIMAHEARSWAKHVLAGGGCVEDYLDDTDLADRAGARAPHAKV